MKCEQPGCPVDGEMRAVDGDKESPWLCAAHWMWHRQMLNERERSEAAAEALGQ